MLFCLAIWQPTIVRTVYVEPAKAAYNTKPEKPKPFAHVKGYERDARNK